MVDVENRGARLYVSRDRNKTQTSGNLANVVLRATVAADLEEWEFPGEKHPMKGLAAEWCLFTVPPLLFWKIDPSPQVGVPVSRCISPLFCFSFIKRSLLPHTTVLMGGQCASRERVVEKCRRRRRCPLRIGPAWSFTVPPPKYY